MQVLVLVRLEVSMGENQDVLCVLQPVDLHQE